MADRDAKVRLNLAANGFLTQLQQLQAAAKDFEKAVEGVGDGGEKASKKLGAFGTAAKAGLGAAKTSLSELGSSLKSTLGQVATLGGALSFASAAKGAIDLQSSYKDIAFAIQAGTGEATTWQTVQKQIEGTGGRWKRSNSEVAESYRMLWEDIGDAKFAAAAVESVARASTATGASMRGLSTIAGQLKEKFNIPTEGLDDALASVIALGNKGGASVEDLGEKIGILGASAKEAGYTGAGGLQKMLGMLNLADNVTGNFRKSLKSVTGVLDTLGDPEKIKNISKELHLELVNPKTKKPFEHALEMIIAKSGGKQEVLAKVFSGDELKLVTDFGKTYKKAFDETNGDLKTKMAAGVAAYKTSLEDAGKQTLTASDLDQQAAQRLSDSKRNFQDALNKLETAFTRPEMVGALEKLAEVAPKVAENMELLLKATDWIAKKMGQLGGDAVIKPVGKWISQTQEGAQNEQAKLEAGARAGKHVATPDDIRANWNSHWYTRAAAWGLRLDPKKYAPEPTGKMPMPDGSPGVPIATPAPGNDAMRAPLAEIRKMHVAQVFERYGGQPALAVAPAKAAAKTEASAQALEKSLNRGSASGDRVAAVLNRVADSAERMNAVFDKFGGPDGSNGLPPAPGNQSGSTPR